MKAAKVQFTLITAGVCILFLTPIVVFAIMLKSAEKINPFRPAKQEVVIAENQRQPAETQENELEWSATTNASGNHVAEKEVSIGEISNPNGEYLRVRLVPAWYDASGCAVAGIDDVSDICSAVIDSGSNTLVFKDSGGTKTMVTVNLAENWQKKWETVKDSNENVLYFKSKDMIGSGNERIQLVSSVELSDTLLQAAKTNDIFLRVDVLADSIQAVEDKGGINPRWS